jgi:hypothetical protein
MKETQKFYDQLADRYHLIFADWDDSVQRRSLTKCHSEYNTCPSQPW